MRNPASPSLPGMAATSPPVRRAVTRLLPGPVAALLVLLLSGVGALGEHRDAAAPDERAAAVQVETTGDSDRTQPDQSETDQSERSCGHAQDCAVDAGADQHAGDAEPGADPRRAGTDQRHATNPVPRNRDAHPSLHAFASVPRPD